MEENQLHYFICFLFCVLNILSLSESALIGVSPIFFWYRLQLDDDEVAFTKERIARNTEQLEQQTHRLQEFDLCTTTMGLDLLQIVQETQDSYRDSYKEDIVGSDLPFRGSSVQNLSGSVSLTAFNRFSDDALLWRWQAVLSDTWFPDVAGPFPRFTHFSEAF